MWPTLHCGAPNKVHMEIIIPIKAVGKQSVRGGSNNVYFMPKKTKEFEARISAYIKYYMLTNKIPMIDKGISTRLDLTIFVKIPPSWSNKKSQEALKGVLRPVVKPDQDNVLKAVSDGAKAIAVYDDNQIVDTKLHKFYNYEDLLYIEIKEVNKEESAETLFKIRSKMESLQ